MLNEVKFNILSFFSIYRPHTNRSHSLYIHTHIMILFLVKFNRIIGVRVESGVFYRLNVTIAPQTPS